MAIDPELQQMLKDAERARAFRSWPVRVWHRLAEWIDVRSSRLTSDLDQPRPLRSPLMIVDDLRHALRRIRSTPWTAVAAAGMLALAIGVTSAMFTVVDHMLINPLPLRQADRLAWVWIGKDLRHSQPYLNPDQVRAVRSTPAFAASAVFAQEGSYIQGVQGMGAHGTFWVSPGAFEMLGVRPLIGRTFAAGEGAPGLDTNVMISERLWRNALGNDPAILGKTLQINGKTATVIGVMPEAFRFPYESSVVWRPYDLDRPSPLVTGGPLYLYGRLRDGITRVDAEAMVADATRPFSKSPAEHGVILRSPADARLDDYSKNALGILLAGVTLVFLVLCANTSNLILARATARRPEFGVCTALGASRRRLVTQVIAENVVLSVAGVVIGVVVAAALVALSRVYLPDAFLQRTLNPIALDLRSIGAAAALGVVAVLLAGVPPAWISTRMSPIESIRLQSRGASESHGASRLSRTLLVGEVSLAASLLVGAGVLLGSFVGLMRRDPGIDLGGVKTEWITLPSFGFTDKAARIAVADALKQSIAAMPGVASVTQSFGMPPNGGAFTSDPMVADGAPAAGGTVQTVYSTRVSPEFFGVYGIRIVEGRHFVSSDNQNAAVVSEGLAGLLWPGQSAVGHTFTFQGWKETMSVVGVSREVRSSLSDPREDLPEYYTPFTPGSSQVMLGIKCAGTCPSESALRERVRSVNTNAVLYEDTTLEDRYVKQFAQPRAAAGLAVAFAVVSVLAAAGGLFSVLSYAVSRRQREFGVRAALGADPSRLRASIVRDGLRLSLAGLGIAAVVTVFASKIVNALAFGVTAASPTIWLGVALVIAGAAVAASWRPATQAMTADPISLLRDN